MRPFILAAFLVAALFPVSVVAQENVYVEFAPGVSFVGDIDIENGAATLETDPGFVVGGAIGTRVADSVRAEFNVSYREQDIDELDVNGFGSLPGVGDAGATTIMVNAIYDLELDFPITPYLGAGLGLGVVTVDSDTGSCVLCIDDTDVQFAWNLMVGGSAAVTEHLSLSAGYRYTGITAPEFEDEVFGEDVEADDPLDIHEIVFGIRYSF
jgi:OOP family OmpA-OmpF porin